MSPQFHFTHSLFDSAEGDVLRHIGQFARFVCHYEKLQLSAVQLQMFIEPIRCENFAEFCRVRKGATNSASNAAKSVLQFLKWAKTEAAFAGLMQKIVQSEDVLRSKRQRWKKAIEVERSTQSCMYLLALLGCSCFLIAFPSQIRPKPMQHDMSG